MKIRLLPIATAIALSASLTTASIVPVTAQAVAKTMADKANPEFVYGGSLGIAGYQTFYLEGIPADVTVSGVQVKGQFGYGSAASTATVMVTISRDLGLTVNTGYRPASTDGTVSDSFDFIVTYSDGSVSKFSQEVRFTPDTQEDAFDPYFENRDFNAGETTERSLSSVPKDAKLSVISEPDGWSASVVKGNRLAVTAPTEPTPTDSYFWQAPQFEFSVVYPDGTSEIVEVEVVAVAVEKPTPISVVSPKPRPAVSSGVAPTSKLKPSSVVTPKPKPSATSAETSIPAPQPTSVATPTDGPTATRVVTPPPTLTTTQNKPAPPKPAATDEKGSSTGAIIAAVVAVLAVVGAGAFVALSNTQLQATLPF